MYHVHIKIYILHRLYKHVGTPCLFATIINNVHAYIKKYLKYHFLTFGALAVTELNIFTRTRNKVTSRAIRPEIDKHYVSLYTTGQGIGLPVEPFVLK